MDVAAWLESLGLERYAQAFRDNAIDAEVLPELTDEHLKELGLPLGPRLKLLKAIAALAPSRTSDATPEVTQPAPPPPASESAAERRQLTVMFADLVGSTVLAGRLDPEDMGALIRAYQAACAGVIARFEGHIAKYMGDGVLAYFGYPRAHEDEAERAVRAGLALVEAVGKLATPAGEPLAARIGIATGLVMVGELIGEGAAQEEAVVGETPNLAARLQDLGAPGSVVIGRRTRQLVGDLFELADLGRHQVKGFARPVRAWRVVGEGAAESRFEARHAAGLTPLVGRKEELALLLRRWELAKEGEGQVVLLSGEPGIGKSRLVRALREQLGDEPHTPLSHYCSPFHRTSALHPIIGLLERAAGLRRDDPPERQLDKLEALLAFAAEDVGEVAPLIADLLAIPTAGRYPPLELSPERKKERTLRALVAQLEGLAATQPVLALYEDAHWIDPSTLELLGLVIDRAPRLRVLVVITFRPEFAPPWTGYAHVTSLSLSRLSRRQIAAIVERVTGGKALPGEVVEQILAKTDGVPLFVEELTKAVLESGLLSDEGDRYALTGPLPPLAIPATLHDSLMARLDRLAPVKEVAQIGAAIGREFAHELIAAVAALDEAKLRDALDQLVASELVFRRGTPPDAVYTFKHALVQDAAYASLLTSRRRQRHARIAEVLEARPGIADVQPEILAHHCTQAGLTEKAIGYWHKAGRRAVERSANAEAANHLTRGLDLLGQLPDGPERARRELALRITLGLALTASKGQGAPEVGAAFARAWELCPEVGDVPQQVAVLQGLRAFNTVVGSLRMARKCGEDLLALAAQTGDEGCRLEGHRAMGVVSAFLGEFATALDHLGEALAIYEPQRHRGHAFLYSTDPGVHCAAYRTWVLWILGHGDQAVEQSRRGLALAERVAHPYSVVQALTFGAFLHQHRRDWRMTRERAEATFALASRQGLPFWRPIAGVLRGWAAAEGGELEAGIAEMRSWLPAHEATGARLFRTFFYGLLAEACGKEGRVEEALRLLDDALAAAAETDERFYEPELHRLRGELLLQRDGVAGHAAERCFRRAIEVARTQQARGWDLRAAASLARRWHDHGRRTEARDLLAPIYGWFTEGFDTLDLRDAKALLDELGRTPASPAPGRQTD